jgi:hypothetical protein
MVAILDDRDVEIDDVAVLQCLVARNAMADLMVDRGADRLRIGLVAGGRVVERRRNAALNIDHVVMAELVEFAGGDSGLTKGVM